MKKHVWTPLRWKDWESFCGFHGQQRKQMIEWVLNKAGVKRELLDTVKARKLAYYGHTMRKVAWRKNNAVCLIASTKRHPIVEMVTPNILTACWTWRTVVIMAYQSAVEEQVWYTGLCISEPCRARVLLNECGSWYGGFPFALRGSEQSRMLLDLAGSLAFSAWRCARAVFAVALCPSVCLSVTSWYRIKTTGRIELVFGMDASFRLSHTVIRKFGYLRKLKLKYFPMGLCLKLRT